MLARAPAQVGDRRGPPRPASPAHCPRTPIGRPAPRISRHAPQTAARASVARRAVVVRAQAPSSSTSRRSLLGLIATGEGGPGGAGAGAGAGA